MPTVTYTQAETDALAHYAAQTAFGTPVSGAPTSSLWRALEEVRPLASILAKHKTAIELAPRTTDIAEMYQPIGDYAMATDLADYQPASVALDALVDLSTTGFVRRTGVDTFAASAILSGDLPGDVVYDDDLAAALAGYQPAGSYVTTSGLSTALGAYTTTAGLGDLALLDTVDLASLVTGILPGGHGGTGNGFMTFTGPASTIKTYTFPNASCSVLTSNAAVTIAQGGTGLTALGSALDVLRVNAAGTALEYAAPSGGASLPVVDTTALVKGSVDATKLVRLSASAVSAGNTRVLTAQDADCIIAGTNIGNTFTAVQTFSANYTSFGGSLFRGINGNGLFELMNNAGATPEGLVFGAASNASSTRLKPSSTVLQVKLSDDSGWARLAAKELAVSNAANASAVGAISKVVEFFDAATGASLGYLGLSATFTP